MINQDVLTCDSLRTATVIPHGHISKNLMDVIGHSGACLMRIYYVLVWLLVNVNVFCCDKSEALELGHGAAYLVVHSSPNDSRFTAALLIGLRGGSLVQPFTFFGKLSV